MAIVSLLTSAGHVHSEAHVQDPWMCGYPGAERGTKKVEQLISLLYF